MERKIIETPIGESLEIDTDYSCGAKPFCIEELQNFLNKVKDNGATHINITGSCWDGSLDDIDIEAVKVVNESDEDFAKRIADAKTAQEQRETQREREEKALYNRLKLKYSK